MKIDKVIILSQDEWGNLFSSRRVNWAAVACIAVGYSVCLVNDGFDVLNIKVSIPSFNGLVISFILTVLSVGIILRKYYFIPFSILMFDLVYLITNLYDIFIEHIAIDAITISYSVMYFIINSLVFKLRYALILNLIIFTFMAVFAAVSIYSLDFSRFELQPKLQLLNAIVLSASGVVLQHLVLTVRAMIIEQLGEIKLQMAALEAQMKIEIAKKEAREQTIRLNRISMIEAMGAGIAHEINQPIAAALAYCQAVRNWAAVECQNAPETLMAIKGVEANVDRAGRLIDNIRLLTSNKDRQYAAVNLHHLVGDQVNLIRAEFERRGIRLSLEPPTGDFTVSVCAPEIALATINLLRNAMEAYDGPTTEAVVIVRCCRPSSDWLEIQVVDNGKGLSPEGIQNAFSAFQTTKQGGVGIGLSICQEVAEHHSGSVSLTANATGGLTAALRLASCREGA